MKKILAVSLCICFISSVVCADTFDTGDNQFTVDFVDISKAKNPASGYGIVNKDYRMGKFEITNAQWNKFKSSLGVSVTGSPSSAYTFDTHWAAIDVLPTTNVSWYEAAQFVNFLNTRTNHQAAYKFTGTQGTSDYSLGVWQAGEAGYDASNPYRNSNAFYFLPTEDEWVKAAYLNGSNLQTWATIGDVSPSQGNGSNGGWNYNNPYGPWAVGSGSEELNGTFDMMGNVWEWMESPYYSGNYLSGSYRSLHGGSYAYNVDSLASSYWTLNDPSGESGNFGFRVASVPEPFSLVLLGLGGLALRYRKQ